MSVPRSLRFAVLFVAIAGCDAQPAVSRVGTNVIEKSIFEGSWYMARTTIALDYEGSGIGYVGEIAQDSTAGGWGWALPRIRWVIDEERLYAFRDYEIVEDGTPPPDDSPLLGTPVAAFRILAHFDIRREYNPSTGEELNIIIEDSDERHWYERQYMRVDWSRNLLSAQFGTSHELQEIFGTLTREPADLYVSNESDLPPSWRPRFHHMSCSGVLDTSPTCRPEDRDWAGDYEQGQLYSFNFVTQEIVSPGQIEVPGMGTQLNCGEANLGMPECASVRVSVRTSFLRVSDRRQYEGVEWTDERHDRAGFFRLDRATYDPSLSAEDPTWGFTDFTNRGATRHNIWRQWYTEAADGSRTPIPYGAREVRPIVWYTSPELPAHLVRPAFETVSEWNEVLMGTVRQLRGQEPPRHARVDCQTDDPEGYCYCQCDPDTNPDRCSPARALNATCAGRYDPFATPDEARAALEPGSTAPYDCRIVVPDGAEPDANDPAVGPRLADSSYLGWFGARMEGSECVSVLRVNSCNLASLAEAEENGTTIECQERGDIRFKLLSYVDQPGTPFLGVAQLRSDPITGEIITGDANIGGPAMNAQRLRAMQAYDLVNGRITDELFFTGEDVRAYLEAANRIDLPAPPRIDFSALTAVGAELDPSQLEALRAHMDRVMSRVEDLQGPEGRSRIFSDRIRQLEGSEIERTLFANEDGLALAGLSNVSSGMGSAPLTDEILSAASPFRHDLGATLRAHADFEQRAGRRAFHLSNQYTDNSVLWFVTQHRGWPRARVEIELSRRLYRETEVHEMGHCLGLVHDFGGTSDSANYADDYYVIDNAYPLPDPSTFDTDGVRGLSPDERVAFEDAYENQRSLRERAGIDAAMNASVMDYTANWYQRIAGSQYYDRMAVRFGYGDIVDIYHNVDGRPLTGSDRVTPANTRRVGIRWYEGGQTCSTDADCPYDAAGRRSGELLPANLSSGLTQRCVANPALPSARVCSNFDEDARALSETLSGTPEWVPVHFRYCDDTRADVSLAWCNRFDEGGSYREIVRNTLEAYQRNYLFAAFRRYRRDFSVWSYRESVLRYFVPMVNLQQDLIYRYQNDAGYGDEVGPWGFADHFLATADVLDFFAFVLGNPPIGSFFWVDGNQRYEWGGPELDGRADLWVELGQGRHFYSVYQAGLTGIDRIERVGSFFDKIFAMQFMTARGLTPYYGPDVAFFANMYDLFPVEMNQIFTGMIANRPDQYMPRVRCAPGSPLPMCIDPRIVFMSFYRGNCRDGDEPTCLPHPADVYANERILNAPDNVSLQSLAAIYALTEFPIYYDTSFQNQLFVCVEGTGDCQTPTGTEGVDYARYTSARFGRSFLAFRLLPDGEAPPNDDSLGEQATAFAMVREARDSDFISRSLRDYRGDFGGAPNDVANLDPADLLTLDSLGYPLPPVNLSVNEEITRLERRVRSLESFFNYLIQLERELGVTFPAPYQRGAR